jgi:hypothetical protein
MVACVCVLDAHIYRHRFDIEILVFALDFVVHLTPLEKKKGGGAGANGHPSWLSACQVPP